jgi:hypothetical protein
MLLQQRFSACPNCNLVVVACSSDLKRCPKCRGPIISKVALVKGPEQCQTATVDDRGERKAAICRANRCGRYDAATDTCGVLTDKGLRGAVAWLLDNPGAACVHSEPCFGVEL